MSERKQGHDICENCIARGDLEVCERKVCNMHISWYVEAVRRHQQSVLDEIKTILLEAKGERTR